MPLTPEQRAEISRANGRRSRGPTSDAGKLQSRTNALKHGLCATTIPLPNEDPEAIAARAAAWADYYRPDSPAAHHLVNQCVRATLLADRCHQVHDAAVADQVDAAALRWERDRQKQVKELRSQLVSDPAAAVEGLGRTGHGCRWLIERWEGLAQLLESDGCWTPDQCAHAIRLLGGRPDPGSLRHDPGTYLLFLFNLRCQPTPQDEVIAIVTQPDRRPVELLGCTLDTLCPPPPFCRDWLRTRARELLDELRASEAEVRTGRDAVERARMLDRAMVLEDEGAARLFFRYHAESRSTFHRAYKELVKTLERDAEFPGGAALFPNEPDAGPTADVFSPNEPDTAALSPNEPAADVFSPNEPDGPPPSPSPNEPDPAADRTGPPVSPNEPSTATARSEETPKNTASSGDGPAPLDGDATLSARVGCVESGWPGQPGVPCQDRGQLAVNPRRVRETHQVLAGSDDGAFHAPYN